MANRAYLYSRDCGDYNAPSNWGKWHVNDGTRYYDSRNNVPWAWFFLFRLPDIKMVDVHPSFPGSSWQEPKFFARRDEALTTFSGRMELLLEIAGEEFDSNEVLARFADTVAHWDGKYLLLDPYEVFHQDDEDDYVYCSNILRRLEEPDVSASEIIAAMGFYSRFEYKDRTDFVKCAVGFTYW